MYRHFYSIFQYLLILLLFIENCKSNKELNDIDNRNCIRDAQIIYPSLVNPDEYAFATCPLEIVYISNSSLPNAGLGVFAACRISQGTCFGPYFGYKHKDLLVADQSGYAWSILNNSGEIMYYVDAFDTRHSNWIRYINCPNRINQENLIKIQYNGNIFYEAIRNIDEGEELLVYYGDEYAEALGINKTQFVRSLSNELDY